MFKHDPFTPRCLLCINFIRITEAERAMLQPKVDELDPAKRDCIGACLRSSTNPNLLVWRYVFSEDDYCLFHHVGKYTETTDVRCPNCKTGRMVITRPIINQQPVIIIGCNNYPNCKTSTSRLPLSTPCRFCGTPLRLSGGDILTSYCPNCLRKLKIPVSLKIWPGLIFPDSGCVHNQDAISCPTCDESRKTKTSVLDIELPGLKDWLSTYRVEGNNPYTRERDTFQPNHETTIQPLPTMPQDASSEYDEDDTSGYDVDDLTGVEEQMKEEEDAHLDWIEDYQRLTDEDQGGNSFI